MGHRGSRSIFLLFVRRAVQCREPPLLHRVHVGAARDQGSHRRKVAFGSSQHQRSHIAHATRVEVHPGRFVNKEERCLLVPLRQRDVQWPAAVRSCGVRVQPVRQDEGAQQAHRACEGSEMNQRRSVGRLYGRVQQALLQRTVDDAIAARGHQRTGYGGRRGDSSARTISFLVAGMTEEVLQGAPRRLPNCGLPAGFGM